MHAKTIQKYSDKSYKKLHERAKHYFHKWIRLRDTDENGIGYCSSSGSRLMYGNKNTQAGHFYPAGKYKALEFDEDNVHLQSLSDNYFGHGNLAPYSLKLKAKIGVDRFETLQRKALQSKRTIFKEDRFLMIDIIEKYKAKCKELAKEKMFEVK